LAGVIDTAIINNDYLKIGFEIRENFDRPFDDSFYVCLFVVARKENADGDRNPARRTTILGWLLRFLHKLPPLFI
jgi:hypothetical protein